MSVFSGRGVMVVGADSFPLSVAGPRMQRGGMGRLELLLWSGQPMNAGMVQAQMTQYKGAGLTVVGWSVHNPGEDHRAPGALGAAPVGTYGDDGHQLQVFIELPGCQAIAPTALLAFGQEPIDCPPQVFR